MSYDIGTFGASRPQRYSEHQAHEELVDGCDYCDQERQWNGAAVAAQLADIATGLVRNVVRDADPARQQPELTEYPGPDGIEVEHPA